MYSFYNWFPLGVAFIFGIWTRGTIGINTLVRACILLERFLVRKVHFEKTEH